MPAPRKLGYRRAANLNGFLKEQPENNNLIGDLALTNMGLGDKAAALALSDGAATAVPIEKNAIDGPVAIEVLAQSGGTQRRA